jgi:gluconate kinase
MEMAREASSAQVGDGCASRVSTPDESPSPRRGNHRIAPLLVVTGPPGAGKSTVARALAERFDPSVLVEGDAFYGFLRRGAIAPWLPHAHSQNTVVTRAAAAAAGGYAAGGYATVYDGVVGPWFLPDFTAATSLDRVEYVVLLPSVERCLRRVTTRRGHGFNDAAATRHMHEQFVTASIDQRHLFVDPPEKAESVTERIMRALAAGDLQYSTS